MKNYQSYLLGFLISLIFAIIVFLPQVNLKLDYLILGLIYGYVWLLPITLGIVFLSRKMSGVKVLAATRQFNYGLTFVGVITLLISWNMEFNNDAVLTTFWLVTLLIWLATYFKFNRI